MNARVKMRPDMRLPPWLQSRAGSAMLTHEMKLSLRQQKLHTVCEEAHCPNIGECFARRTATFLIMGNACTRRCSFCAVGHGIPRRLDPGEAGRVAEQVRGMHLKHAVITSVTRDDLPDGGAKHFACTIRAIRKTCPSTTVEVLTPDFEGRKSDIAIVCDAAPDVFSHNLETVERLTPSVRSHATYKRSLSVLALARRALTKGGKLKSGLMVGLGETADEVRESLRDLARAGCEIVTIGQYLRPSRTSHPVIKYVEPETFQYYEEMGLNEGIKCVFAGPLVRSSYLADEVFHERS